MSVKQQDSIEHIVQPAEMQMVKKPYKTLAILESIVAPMRLPRLNPSAKATCGRFISIFGSQAVHPSFGTAVL